MEQYSQPALDSAPSTEVRSGTEGRKEDRTYKVMTIAAILLLIASLWLF
jgi:hypothetical protein